MGKEAIKGTEHIRSAAQYLEDCPAVDYVGFIEGDDLFSHKADVIVCDGLVGNAVMKTAEGLMRYLAFNSFSTLLLLLF